MAFRIFSNQTRRLSINFFLMLFFLTVSSCSSSEADTDISCNSDKTRKLILVEFFARPQLESGQFTEIEPMKVNDKGIIKMGGIEANYSYSNGELGIDFNTGNEKGSVTFALDYIVTKSNENDAKRNICSAKVNITTTGGPNSGKGIVAIEYTSEITDDKKHLVNITDAKPLGGGNSN